MSLSSFGWLVESAIFCNQLRIPATQARPLIFLLARQEILAKGKKSESRSGKRAGGKH